jgi:hypothetical protein
MAYSGCATPRFCTVYDHDNCEPASQWSMSAGGQVSSWSCRKSLLQARSLLRACGWTLAAAPLPFFSGCNLPFPDESFRTTIHSKMEWKWEDWRHRIHRARLRARHSDSCGASASTAANARESDLRVRKTCTPSLPFLPTWSHPTGKVGNTVTMESHRGTPQNRKPRDRLASTSRPFTLVLSSSILTSLSLFMKSCKKLRS